MKQLLLTTLLAGSFIAGLATDAAAKPNRWNHTPTKTAADFRYRIDSRNPYANNRRSSIDRLNQGIYGATQADIEKSSSITPASTLGPASQIGDIDAPGGKIWTYTADMEYEENVVSEYYTDYILKSFKFTIYDENNNVVGTISDLVHYEADEVRAVACDPVPVMTRNFFNVTDDYEFAIGLAVNTKTPGFNRYKTVVYSLDGAKMDGYDVPVMIIDNFVSDVCEGPEVDGRDNYFMTFSCDVEDDTLTEESTFWEYLMSYKMKTMTYARAVNNTDGPVMIDTHTMPMLCLPGNQDSAPFLMSMVHDGEVYFMFQRYAEPIWEEYNDPIYDETVQRSGNTLNVEFYKATPDSFTPAYTTNIPVVLDDIDGIMGTFYSVGNMRYRGDVNFGAYGEAADRAALYVTKEHYYPAADSQYTYSVYNSQGLLVKTFAEDTAGCLALSDIEGFEPQEMFIIPEGNYRFSFVNLTSGTEAFSITNSITFDDITDNILTNLDRTPVGDSYQYAIECTAPVSAENGRVYMQIIWLKADGTPDRREYADMGSDIQYAQCYIDGEALKEGAYVTGKRAYMMLAKHGLYGEALQEELIISESQADFETEGKEYLRLTPDDKGILTGIIPVWGEDSRLDVYYRTEGSTSSMKYTLVSFDLPLQTSGIEGISDGRADLAEGEVQVYNIMGQQVAKYAAGATPQLPAGVYIFVTRDHTYKVVVK